MKKVFVTAAALSVMMCMTAWADQDVDRTGNYNYYQSELYVKNPETGTYDLYKNTKTYDSYVDYNVYENDVWYERGTLGLAGDLASTEVTVASAQPELVEIRYEDYPNSYYYVPQADNWSLRYYTDQNNIYSYEGGAGKTEHISDRDGLEFGENAVVLTNRFYVGEEFRDNDGNILSSLVGKDVLYKEIFKKK